jgi:hypothetical protein
MLRGRSVAIALALLLLTGNAVSASDVDRDTTSSATSDSHLAPFLEQCPFKRWASIDTVKEFYRITDDPVEEPSPFAGSGIPHPRSWERSTYHYLLGAYGVVVRFGTDLQMLELGVRRPFRGAIGGVAIGATKEDVQRIRGKNFHFEANSRDPAFLKLQRELKSKVLQKLPDPAPHGEISKAVDEIRSASGFPPGLTPYLLMLPDPAPKKDVREALERVTILDEASLKYSTHWTYSGGSGSTYVTYYFAPDDTVQAIYASNCDVE